MIALAVDLMMFHFFWKFRRISAYWTYRNLSLDVLESDNRILPFLVNFAVRFDFFFRDDLLRVGFMLL